MSDDSMNELLELFLYETIQFIRQLEEIVLDNEKEGHYSEKSVNEIFRIMHTIKGSAAMMNYTGISTVAHALEDLFSYIRENIQIQLDYSALTDIILEGIDFTKIELEKIKNGDMTNKSNPQLIEQIGNMLNAIKSGQKRMEHYRITVRFEPECKMEHIRAFSLVSRLKQSVANLSYYPDVDTTENTEEVISVLCKQGLTIDLETEQAYEKIIDVMETFDSIAEYHVGKVAIAEIKETLSENTAEQEHKTDVNTEKQSSIISVSVDKLDKLMDLMGELVIAEAMVVQNPDLKDLVLDNFIKAATQLNKITEEMQDMIMSVRMVPLSATFHKMNRLVRDMSKKLGKEVILELVGEETEVDKNIIERISDPLMHLVRNAVDHGIESPEARIFVGKNKTGKITLEACNAGGDVVVKVRDDGIGLEKDRILEKAIERGILTKSKEDMTEREILNLIFVPGFSTNHEVSEFSGRGVGMDVVMRNIEMAGGSVTLESAPNKGTTVVIKIPLTLAIIDGMNIRVGRSNYTIPTTSVMEFFRPERKDITKSPEGNEMILVRGRCYPILRLNEFYSVKEAETMMDKGIMIIVEQEEKMICLFADELLGQQQVVVKALPKYIQNLKEIKGLTGCTLLGDGVISLILDVSGLVVNNKVKDLV